MDCPIKPKGRPYAWIEGSWDVYGSKEPVYFPVGYALPRVCSHCGSCHPDDLIALARAGWQLHNNRVLLPPGCLEALDRAEFGVLGRFGSYPRSPNPAVTGFSQHFNDEQLWEFNQLVTARYCLA